MSNPMPSAGYGTDLYEVYERVEPPLSGPRDKPVYAVRPVPGAGNHLVGKDGSSHACLLVDTVNPSNDVEAPIQLENLVVQFSLPSLLQQPGSANRESTLTIIKCQSHEPEIVRYFFAACEVILKTIVTRPEQRTVAIAVRQLADIFQKLSKPPTRAITGLMGELYLISRSARPTTMLKGWRTDPEDRFDFTFGNLYLDAKTTRAKARIHSFSYDQCNPDPDTTAAAASLFIESPSDGTTMKQLVKELEARVATHTELVLKLHDVVAATLGNSLAKSLEATLDTERASASLAFFDLRQIPAIREPLPAGVSGVRFNADLSGTPELSAQELIAQNQTWVDILPSSTQ